MVTGARSPLTVIRVYRSPLPYGRGSEGARNQHLCTEPRP
jgi:hypothetical protein